MHRLWLNSLKISFHLIWIPRPIISNEGSHFCNHLFEWVLKKYKVTHKVIMLYHPQTSGQVEITNRQVNWIPEKIVTTSRKDWTIWLDDALWVYQTIYTTPIGTSPCQLVYEKSYYFPVELLHKMYLVTRFLNFDQNKARE